MENNIFKDAYFGKAYKTRVGKKMIYWWTISMKETCNIVPDRVAMISEHCKDRMLYNLKGECETGAILEEEHIEDYDIVSEWIEPIDEGELDKLALKAVPRRFEYSNDVDVDEPKRECWKDGFRTARKE